MNRFAIIAAGAILASTVPANAVVVYKVTGSDFSLQYTSPTFITATTVVAAGDADACTAPTACTGALFQPNFFGGDEFSLASLGVGGSGNRGLRFVLNAFSASGLYQDVDGHGSLVVSNVSAGVPEPATWGMITLGFGAMGFTIRRRAKMRMNVTFA